jgi:hypothetical protein
MIQINSTTQRDLDIISDEYYDLVKNYLLKKITNVVGASWLKEFLLSNIYKVITGQPQELHIINAEYKRLCTRNKYKQRISDEKLEAIFNYEWLANNKKRAYDFAHKLQINVCPYCNRNYTVTVIEKNNGERTVRPDFDHFFPKSKYPLLALSFYNLIPSCSICNRSIKGAKQVVYGKFIHPYEEAFSSDLKFNYIAKDTNSAMGIKKNLEIKELLSATNKGKAGKCNNNFKLFKLKEIYQTSHLDEVADIIRKYHVSGGKYLEILHNRFKRLGTIEELYKIAFGNYYNEVDFDKRPLAKLTRDIVDQLSFTIPKVK